MNERINDQPHTSQKEQNKRRKWGTREGRNETKEKTVIEKQIKRARIEINGEKRNRESKEAFK
jgi:hypothetical protein